MDSSFNGLRSRGINLANGKKRKRIRNDKQHLVSTTLRTISTRGIRGPCDEFLNSNQKKKLRQLEEYRVCVIGTISWASSLGGCREIKGGDKN
ncbi:hypothetical protein Tco_0704019 [Tanacetum coccineum]|uniref:Uncharacterized protein n=1 Tax=Tanacetum coccineum TaxID=301880 RepID=A0ABQ4Y2F7_9ASTR